jgi:putative intracellular protease/amidase
MRGQERVAVSLLLLSAVSLAQTPGRRAPQQAATVVPLPAPTTEGSVDINAALGAILNRPAPSDLPLTMAQISQLAWAAQGRPTFVTEPNAPAGEGALLKVHFALPDGLYLYVPSSHSLQQTRNIDVRAALAAGLLNRARGPIGGCQIIISGTSRDFTAQYGDRARDAMYLLAGRMVQSIQLEAVASNLTFIGINNANAATVTKVCGLGKGIEPLYVLLTGHPVVVPPRTKKVLIIVPDGFQDEEFFETKRLLEMNSIQVVVAGMRAGPIRSMRGATAVADLAFNELHGPIGPRKPGAIVFVGGTNLGEVLNHPAIRALPRLAGRQMPIAASGNAPALIMSWAGGAVRAHGIAVTCAPEIASLVLLQGARYTGRAVEKDRWLITSVGAPAVPLFVQAILDGMNGQ